MKKAYNSNKGKKEQLRAFGTGYLLRAVNYVWHFESLVILSRVVYSYRVKVIKCNKMKER